MVDQILFSESTGSAKNLVAKLEDPLEGIKLIHAEKCTSLVSARSTGER